MSDTISPLQRGAQLVGYFQAALFNFANAEASRQEAIASEERALNELHYYSGSNLLNPQNIPRGSGAEIVKSSVDAHIKKVQAEQIEHMSKVQLANANSEASTGYVGRKIIVKIYNKNSNAVESVWFSPNTGYKTSEVKTNIIKGRIKEVLLEKNAILVTPNSLSRLMDPGRKYFIIYVIDSRSFEPAAELEIY